MKKPVAFLALFLLLALSANIYAQGAPAPSDYTTDPYYNMQYDDQSKLANAGQKEIDALKTDPKIGFVMDAIPSASTIAMRDSLVSNTFIMLFIMAMIIGMMYMAGNFLQIPNVIALAKQEINEWIASAFIGVMFLAFIASSVPISQAVLGTDVFNGATLYSYKVLDKMSTVSSVLMTANIALNSIYTLYIPFGPVRRAMTIQLGPALRPMIDMVSFTLQFLITSYGEWLVFIFIFGFIKAWFIPFFFPLGLFLRSFPHTRGGGNTLIALSLALSIVYPAMFYLDMAIFDKQFPPGSSIGTYFAKAVLEIWTTLSVGGVAALFLVLSPIYISGFFISALLILSRMFWDMMIDTINLVVIFSILLPILNIFITISFAREVSKALGTEINLSAFAKLI